ncbi:hypothetical protein [Nocardiopsis sp. YSL2]|uniref:hypothetical protein n=1 Tax=Nocardiopsis sp. YSL2 TaxID=2939492 RepID=UPI0026F417E2|nr:hypothetical protein [Nocardiopsis sp. YSL2]
MTVAMLDRVKAGTDPAGAPADDLFAQDLIAEGNEIYASSSGWVCSLTIECGTLVCACQ